MLFVLLAGIGFTLLTRRAREGAPVPWQQVLWRALVLLLVGLSTQLLDHGLDVILTTYAMLFLVALAFVQAPSWLLLEIGRASCRERVGIAAVGGGRIDREGGGVRLRRSGA